MKLRISKIHETAAERPAGYVEDILSQGIVEGDWLEISQEAMAGLRLKYRGVQKEYRLTERPEPELPMPAPHEEVWQVPAPKSRSADPAQDRLINEQAKLLVTRILKSDAVESEFPHVLWNYRNAYLIAATHGGCSNCALSGKLNTLNIEARKYVKEILQN